MSDEAVEIRGEIRFCVFCLNKEPSGVWFLNGKINEDQRLRFMYMGENEASHIECYIKECVRMALNEMNSVITSKDTKTQPRTKE